MTHAKSCTPAAQSFGEVKPYMWSPQDTQLHTVEDTMQALQMPKQFKFTGLTIFGCGSPFSNSCDSIAEKLDDPPQFVHRSMIERPRKRKRPTRCSLSIRLPNCRQRQIIQVEEVPVMCRRLVIRHGSTGFERLIEMPQIMCMARRISRTDAGPALSLQTYDEAANEIKSPVVASTDLLHQLVQIPVLQQIETKEEDIDPILYAGHVKQEHLEGDDSKIAASPKDVEYPSVVRVPTKRARGRSSKSADLKQSSIDFQARKAPISRQGLHKLDVASRSPDKPFGQMYVARRLVSRLEAPTLEASLQLGHNNYRTACFAGHNFSLH